METSLPGFRSANVCAFKARLARVSEGNLQSAFDEFLSSRVPIQLGGLHDPFSEIELTRRITLDLLTVLNEYDYPTLISTKSTLPTQAPYLSLLRTMNVLVRFSAAGITEKCRAVLEVGCARIDELMDAIACLSGEGIPVSLRIQPVIPGHEDAAITLAKRAAGAGVMHVSFEYLKIGTEERDETIKRVSSAIGTDIWKAMSERGMKRLGRDYTLIADAKRHFLKTAKQACREAGVKFGAGDTEFIHFSDGSGCCNGSGHFLQNATQFRANFVGVMSNPKKGMKIYFSDLDRQWQPKLNIHQYLTTNSRGRSNEAQFSSWMSLLAYRWNGKHGPYSPAFFFGVGWTGNYDDRGYKIYQIEEVL